MTTDLVTVEDAAQWLDLTIVEVADLVIRGELDLMPWGDHQANRIPADSVRGYLAREMTR